MTIAWGSCHLFFIIECAYFSTQPAQEDEEKQLQSERKITKKAKRKFISALWVATFLNLLEVLADYLFSFGDVIQALIFINQKYATTLNSTSNWLYATANYLVLYAQMVTANNTIYVYILLFVLLQYATSPQRVYISKFIKDVDNYSRFKHDVINKPAVNF